MSTPTTSTPTTWRGPAWPRCARRPQRVLHACDDTDLRMGDYFDLAADLCGLPRPPRIGARRGGRRAVAACSLSFMSESRRLDNQRLKRELKLRLRYPSVAEGLRAAG
jgi:nucleoside-diphosphate-sugar epimerase